MGLNASNRHVIRQSKADEENRFRHMNDKASPNVEQVEERVEEK
jgi:hypothetical protein